MLFKQCFMQSVYMTYHVGDFFGLFWNVLDHFGTKVSSLHIWRTIEGFHSGK